MHPGYFGIVLLMVFSPFPPEVFIPLAGFMASQGELNVLYVVLVGMLGFLLSVLPWYWAGRYLGERKLQEFLRRHRWLVIPPEALAKANRWFQQQGGRAILLSLLVPGIRNIIALPAGLSSMPFLVFLGYTMGGAAVWLALLAIAGYSLGSQYYLVKEYVGSFYNVVIAVLVISVAVWAVRQSFKRKKMR